MVEQVLITREVNPKKLKTGAYYEMLLDPEHALPQIQIIEHPTQTQGTMKFLDFDIVSDESKIGKFTLIVGAYQGGTQLKAWLNGIKIDEKFRKKGFGRAVYKEIFKYCADKKIQLLSGTSLTKGSQSAWNWLVENGAAKNTSNNPIESYHMV